MQYITVLDYILLPIYIAFFYWRVRKIGNKPESAGLKKYLFIAFALRMLGTVAYSMLIQYYYGYGDSFTYFEGSNFFTEQIANAPGNFSYLFSSFKETAAWYDGIAAENTGYFMNPSNNLVMRISAILSYVCFNKFLIIALFFGYFSFLGQWKLFLVFDDINKHKNRKLLALVILCTPSIWFWSSGLLKDSICLGSMGYIVHIVYKMVVKKKFALADLFALLVLLYVVFTIKSYITSIFLAGGVIMVISEFFISIKNKLIRATLLFMAIILSVIVLYYGDFSEQINEGTEKAVEQIKEFQQSYVTIAEKSESSKAAFAMGEFDPSINSLILKSPLVIFTCLFRPFPWESEKLIIFFASIESMLLLLATLFVMIKLGVVHFFTSIFNTPHLLFCFTISILFSLVIGFTTFNFGTMIRYKVIFLPFYYFLLVNMYSNYRQSRIQQTGNMKSTVI